MIKSIIFDLDNCLFDPSTIPKSLVEPAFQSVRLYNAGENLMAHATLDEALDLCWRRAFDEVAHAYKFPDQLIEYARATFSTLEVKQPLQPYPDIAAIQTLSTKNFLVTTGYTRLQRSKVECLGIRPLFEDVFIDALENPERGGKQPLFSSILEKYSYNQSEVVIVGDSAESEITAGNNLGIATVQIIRKGIIPSPKADYHIKRLFELKGIIESLN